MSPFDFGFSTVPNFSKTNTSTAAPMTTEKLAIRKYILHSFSLHDVKTTPKNNASNVTPAPPTITNIRGKSAPTIDAKITPAKTNLERSRK
jgi:hypothetical protein